MVRLKEKQTKKKKETKSVSETGLSPLYYLVKTEVWNCLLKFQSDQNPLETVFPGSSKNFEEICYTIICLV